MLWVWEYLETLIRINCGLARAIGPFFTRIRGHFDLILFAGWATLENLDSL